METMESTGYQDKRKEKKNVEQKHLAKAFHQDTEPLIDTLVQVRMQLRKLESPRPSMVPSVPSFYKLLKYFGGFYIEILLKN